MRKAITRRELYDLVWARPMTKVAADFEVSDVALHKVCKKHRVPTPGRGYWAKVAAGKPVKQVLFRDVQDRGLDRIVIHGSPAQRLPEAVKEVGKVARERERKPENKVEVVSTPAKLHPKVSRTQVKLEKAKPSERGLVAASGVTFFDVEVGPESVDRAIAFLNALVTASEARGHRTIKGDQRLVFLVNEEPLEVKLVEQTTRSKHEPTEAEVKAIEKWEMRQQRLARSWNSIDWTPRPDPPEWDYAPNGHLKVTINEGRYGPSGLRKTFADGKTQTIETLINSLLEAFATWAAAIKTTRIEDEKRKQERQEEARQWEEQKRRNALETKRIEALSQDLERWRQRQEILEYVIEVEAKLKSGEQENREAAREWIDWARAYADRIDPLSVGLPKLAQFEDFNPWELRH